MVCRYISIKVTSVSFYSYEGEEEKNNQKALKLLFKTSVVGIYLRIQLRSIVYRRRNSVCLFFLNRK